MNEPSNVRILERKAPVPAPDDTRPPSLRSATPQAIIAARPDWAYLFAPGSPAREATQDEAEAYARREADPAWAPLYRLVLDAEAVRSGLISPPPADSPLIAIPAEPAAPEPEPDAEPAPAPKTGEQAPDGYDPATVDPAMDQTSVMPVADQLTEIVEAVPDGGDGNG